MGSAKVRLDIVNGVLELEGDQAFVEKELMEFRAMVASGTVPCFPSSYSGTEDEAGDGQVDQADAASGNGRTKAAKQPKNTRKSRPVRSAPQFLAELDMRGLKEFCDEKKPKSHYEKYCVIASWLAMEREISAVGEDHVNTCYRHLEWSRPQKMRQVFTDAKNKFMLFVETADKSLFRLTHKGEDLVSLELPTSPKK